MKTYYLFILSFCCITNIVNAQIKGLIQGADGSQKKPIYGAKIKLLQAKTGTVSREDGTFELVLPKELPDTLVISAFGYNPDTLIVSKKDRFTALNILLYSDKLLPEILIEYRKNGRSISRLKTLHVEELTAIELRKAACCNLSESFETNASVDVNITDAVSGAKKIQMMGLDGVYTQIQMENIPYLRGLESAFGLSSLSGTWIESIQITKGTGNVVNGYESMAGLVNLELKKPDEMEKIYLNVYQNIFGRSEFNFNKGIILNPKWSTGFLGHFSSTYGNIDRNKDAFRDLPMGDNTAFMNRWAYKGKKMEAQFGINFYRDRKVGGQTSFFRNEENQVDTINYGVLINSKHIDIYGKTGFFGKRPMQSLGIVYNIKHQEIDGFFGLKNFSGLEKRGYINVIYDDIIGTSDHTIKIGTSFVALDISQKADTLSQKRMELVPGIFAEYTYTGRRLTGVFGSRYDYHSIFREQFSPRVHLKYLLSEMTDLRFTAGKGWRVPNFIIDNISLLASSKQWIAPSETKPEISWNIGGSLVHEMKIFERKSTISLDFYHTRFENQLIIDRDETVNTVVFSNLKNSSFSNSFQTEFSFSPIKNLDIRFAYKFLDVEAKYGNEMRQQVMIPRHRGFVNLAFRSRNKRWEYDFTCSIFSPSRLPIQRDMNNDTLLISDMKSRMYPMMNAQITHIYKKFDFYIGGENLTNFRQRDPIIDASNPFGSKFDATNICGPLTGVNIYVGIRYAIAKTKK